MILPSPPFPPDPDGDFVWDGGRIDRTAVTLRFTGDDLDPDLISRLLQCRPTHVVRKGDERPRRSSGRSQLARPARIARTGCWRLQSPPDPDPTGQGQDLEERIAQLLDGLPDDPLVWAALAEHCRGDLFCGLFLDGWNRGFSLSPALLQRIAERHLTIDFDIYCNGESEREAHETQTEP